MENELLGKILKGIDKLNKNMKLLMAKPDIKNIKKLHLKVLIVKIAGAIKNMKENDKWNYPADLYEIEKEHFKARIVENIKFTVNDYGYIKSVLDINELRKLEDEYIKEYKLNIKSPYGIDILRNITISPIPKLDNEELNEIKELYNDTVNSDYKYLKTLKLYNDFFGVAGTNNEIKDEVYKSYEKKIHHSFKPENDYEIAMTLDIILGEDNKNLNKDKATKLLKTSLNNIKDNELVMDLISNQTKKHLTKTMIKHASDILFFLESEPTIEINKDYIKIKTYDTEIKLTDIEYNKFLEKHLPKE